jgi:putative ATPase
MTTPIPLAERLRPKSFAEYVGQKGKLEKILRCISQSRPMSVIFWGPPGCGKTTIARLYIKHFSHPIETLHATSAATQDIRKIIERTVSSPLLFRPTIVWIDEVHRLTRPQQDILLSSVEDGSLIVVAATTENPSFQLAPALLSRLQTITLDPLENDDLITLVTRAESECPKLKLTDEAKKTIALWAQGDARALFNMLEQLTIHADESEIGINELTHYLQKKQVAIDPTGEGRYQLISALHKSVRGSDCQAALYWFCRQIAAGEDVRYIARRLIRMATEDIGLADPQALSTALDGLKAYETLGSPEGELAIAQVVIYLALAPKSNALYMAYKNAKELAEKSGQLAPPKHIINGVTKWMQKQGIGAGYQYDHDTENGFSGQTYFPEAIDNQELYTPVARGFERELTKRIAYFTKLRQEILGN